MADSGTERPLGFRPEEISALINEPVVTQHADDAASLWVLRDAAVSAPHYSLQDLADLDERVEANVDGLRIAGEFGWNLCKDALSIGEPGEVFAAGVLAFGDGRVDRISAVLEVATPDWNLARAAVSALGWLPFEQVKETIRDLMESDDARLRRIGFAASGIHRKNPGRRLPEAMQDPDPCLRARAMKLAAELGRTDLIPDLAAALADPEETCRFHAAAACLRLGLRRSDVHNVIRPYAVPGNPFADRALAIGLPTLSPGLAREWCQQLRQSAGGLRLALTAYGILGDPAVMDEILACTAQDDVARVAGEAISRITGVDLAYDDLDRDQPEDFEAGPTESPEDEDVTMDSDEDLPWPDPEQLGPWWEKHRGEFTAGKRYLCGKEIATASLRETLAKGFQRQRAAAALELAVVESNAPLFEVRAEGKKQQRELAAASPGG